MQEIEYFTCIYHLILFFCSKRSYLIMKIHNKKELKNIATNYSADIDHKNVIKIYSKSTGELHSFLTIDSTLLADNPLRFRKNLLIPL